MYLPDPESGGALFRDDPGMIGMRIRPFRYSCIPVIPEGRGIGGRHPAACISFLWLDRGESPCIRAGYRYWGLGNRFSRRLQPQKIY